jgi:hypothetical protein
MKIIQSLGTGNPYGLEVSFDAEGFSYKVYNAYETAELQKFWMSMTTADFSINPNNPLNQNSAYGRWECPMPQTVPAWTTDKYSVYDKLIDGTELPSGRIDYADFKPTTPAPGVPSNFIAFHDHSVYSVASGDISTTAVSVRTVIGFTQSTKNRLRVPIYNLVADSNTTKLNPLAATARYGFGHMIVIAIPFADSTPDQYEIILSCGSDPDLLKITSGETPTVTTEPIGNVCYRLPKIYFTEKTATVSPDGYVDLSVYIGDGNGALWTGNNNADVYLKTTGGYLSKTQFRTVNQKGTVRFVASHLVAGDEVTISCGFKYYSGTDDCVIKVQ